MAGLLHVKNRMLYQAVCYQRSGAAGRGMTGGFSELDVSVED